MLGVVPQGVVVEAAPFPDLKPGARMGFRRPGGDTALVGEGWVLDVREGRGLVGLTPGGSVQVGDLAVLCASASAPGGPGDLRGSTQAVAEQLAAAGGGPAEAQATIGQLRATIDAREAAIRGGACDVTEHDGQIAALGAQLQELLAAPPSTTTSSSPAPAGGAEQGGDMVALMQQLVQVAQSMGLGGARGSDQATEVAPLPADPGSGTGSQPPFVAPSPPPSVGTPSPPAATAPPPTGGTPPPSTAGTPPSPPPTGRPPGVAQPPVTVTSPWWTIAPPKATPPAPGALPGTSTRRPGTTAPPGTRFGPGGVTLPAGAGLGTVTRVQPEPQRMATVQGVVRGDNGRPLPGALVSVGGRQARTNTHGVFVVTSVPLGRQALVATAEGFSQGKLSLELTSGEVERVALTLRRAR